MSSVEESIIATQRSIITIQDELNATNDSIIELLKIDNARLTKELDTLHKEWKNLFDYRGLSDKEIDRLNKKLYDIQHFLDDTGDDLSNYLATVVKERLSQ